MVQNFERHCILLGKKIDVRELVTYKICALFIKLQTKSGINVLWMWIYILDAEQIIKGKSSTDFFMGVSSYKTE